MPARASAAEGNARKQWCGWYFHAAPPGSGARPARPASYAAPEGEAIQRELENWKAFIAGTDVDEQLNAMIVLLHQDFADYDGLRQKLEGVSGSQKIVLRPACQSRRSIEDARRVIDAHDWHPQAKSTPMTWHFDARFSGFLVSVDDSAPEVATALEQRLGKLVRTRLNNHHRPRAGANPQALGATSQ